jgi:hypothetical protein
VAGVLIGAVTTFTLTALNDETFDVIEQMRHDIITEPSQGPINFVVRAKQEVKRDNLRKQCDSEIAGLRRSIFAPGICTIYRSRTCVLERFRWSGKEIKAPLVSEEFWDHANISEEFSRLGDDNLRFQLSHSAHLLNEALSNGKVDFSSKTVFFAREELARTYYTSMNQVCGALNLRKPLPRLTENEYTRLPYLRPEVF